MLDCTWPGTCILPHPNTWNKSPQQQPVAQLIRQHHVTSWTRSMNLSEKWPTSANPLLPVTWVWPFLRICPRQTRSSGCGRLSSYRFSTIKAQWRRGSGESFAMSTSDDINSGSWTSWLMAIWQQHLYRTRTNSSLEAKFSGNSWLPKKPSLSSFKARIIYMDNPTPWQNYHCLEPRRDAACCISGT